MFVAGWNLAGCVSNPDSNFLTDDWNAAVTYLVDQIESWWDADYDMDEWQVEQGYDSSKSEIDARYINAHADLHNNPMPPNFNSITYDYAGNVWEIWIVETEGDFEEEME